MLKKNDYLLLKKFLSKCIYTDEEVEYINNNFGKENVFCFLRQIYAALEMISDNQNEYLKIFNYLVRNFDLGCNILEIAGGKYPILASYIDRYQLKIGKGTITVIDPGLSVDKVGNINLLKKEFIYGDCIDEYDFIISQAPCLKIDDVVVSAIEKNKQFFVSMCQCIYDRYPDLADYYFDDEGFDPLHNKLLSEMRDINNMKSDKQLYIDSATIFNNNCDIKCFTGKKLIKK